MTLCNTSPNQAADLVCNLHGAGALNFTGRILTAESMNACNTFESPEAVQPNQFDRFSICDDNLTITLPAKSVVALTLT